jgi:hypothetical protein
MLTIEKKKKKIKRQKKKKPKGKITEKSTPSHPHAPTT